MEARPQRHNSSSKPARKPRPPQSSRSTNFGCTGPGNGERRPEQVAAMLAAPRTAMPRVGSTLNDRAPFVHFDQVDAVARPAAHVAGPTSRAASAGQGVAGDGEAVEPDVVGHVG